MTQPYTLYSEITTAMLIAGGSKTTCLEPTRGEGGGTETANVKCKKCFIFSISWWVLELFALFFMIHSEYLCHLWSFCVICMLPTTAIFLCQFFFFKANPTLPVAAILTSFGILPITSPCLVPILYDFHCIEEEVMELGLYANLLK